MNTPKKCSLLTVSISLFIGLTIVFSGFQTFGEEWTEEQKEILNLEEKYWASVKTVDKVNYENMLHANILTWPSNARDPRNKFETVYFMKQWMNYDPPIEIEIIPMKISFYSNIALIFYNIKWNGKELSDHSRAMHIWAKENGSWSMIYGMGASYYKYPKR